MNQDASIIKPCTTSSGHSERCHNPLCRNTVAPIVGGWRRTERFYCSDTCKQRASILHRAAELLMGLSDEKVIKILRQEQMKPQVNPAPSAEDLAKFRESHSNISFEDTHRA